MLAGGADAAIIPSGMGGFIACKALSSLNASPEKASRPWDKGRDGFVMGEGAGESSKRYRENGWERGVPYQHECTRSIRENGECRIRGLAACVLEDEGGKGKCCSMVQAFEHQHMHMECMRAPSLVPPAQQRHMCW